MTRGEEQLENVLPLRLENGNLCTAAACCTCGCVFLCVCVLVVCERKSKAPSLHLACYTLAS